MKTIALGNVSKTAVNWPAFVAEEKGSFRQEGVAPDVVYVGNVANTVQQLVGGTFDVAISTFDTAVRAIVKGGGATIIGGMTVKYPYNVMTAPNVRKAADLKGRTIILPFPKDLLTSIWNRWLREQGLQPGAVEQIYDGATPNRYNALIAGAAQAAMLNQPFDFRAAEQGYGKLLDTGSYAKDFGFLAILARPQWARDNPDTAQALLRALSTATDWLYDPANRDEAIAILARQSRVDPTIAAQTYDYYIKELQPFSRKLVIPDGVVDNTGEDPDRARRHHRGRGRRQASRRHQLSAALNCALCYGMIRPPLTCKVWPVMKRAAGPARNRIGPMMSSGVPIRPMGVIRSYFFASNQLRSASSPPRPVPPPMKGVSIPAGATLLARTCGRSPAQVPWSG